MTGPPASRLGGLRAGAAADIGAVIACAEGPEGRVETVESICHSDAIRTTLDIDDELITTLLARLPGRSKTDAIEHAIEAFLANDSVERLKQLAGTMDVGDLSQELRRLDRMA
jgi:hypothetical protein